MVIMGCQCFKIGINFIIDIFFGCGLIGFNNVEINVIVLYQVVICVVGDQGVRNIV